jgi:RNA polymerase sigma-70 factor (ECF subfamily)
MAMLKIQVEGDRDGQRLKLEGRAIGAWVHELERECERLLADDASLTLDLAGVSFLDHDAVRLLRALSLRDVTLVNASPFLAQQLGALSPAPGVDEDLQLVERTRAGDAAALERLMERHASSVYRLVCGITRNTADAEEVVQDVFLAVFRKIGRFEARSTVRTWIYRIAVNTALNKRRGKRREVEVPIEEFLPAFLPDGHRAGERDFLLADWSDTPEEVFLAGAGRATLQRAIDELPDDYRAVLVMRDVEGLSNEEVAGVLGHTVSSVKSRLHRARLVLRERLTRSFQLAVPAAEEAGPRAVLELRAEHARAR